MEAALIVVDKTARTLSLVAHGETMACFPVLVGQNLGAKEREGDGRTPEGCYFVLRLLPDENAVGNGFYKGLHLSYPGIADAARGLDSGLIDAPTFQQIVQAYQKGNIPPQETALGGYVAIHAGLADDEPFMRGTKGCIVMRNTDMDVVFAFAHAGIPVIIHA